MVKVIAVDFGGVYFTWNYERYVRQIADATGVSSRKVKNGLSKKIIDFHVSKVTEKEYWHAFCSVIGKEVDHRLLKKITENQFKPIKPVIALIKRLRKKYMIVLLANQTVVLDALDTKYHFYKNFDLLLSSHIIKMQKPQKNIFRLLIQQTHVGPQDILFIDDTKENVDSAKALGIRSLLFKSIMQLKKDLKVLGITVK